MNAGRHDAVEPGRESVNFVVGVDDFDGERQDLLGRPDPGGVRAT